MKNYYHYLVAFIDILGQKEAFKENGKYIDQINEYINNPKKIQKRLSKSHMETASVIQGLRKSFKTLFKEAQRNDNPKIKVPSNQNEIYKKLRKCELKIHPFSDSFIAYTPLAINDNRCAANVVNGIMSLLFSCGTIMALSLLSKKPIRGAIEIGLGTEIGKDEVYGPALYRAYEIESKIAQYPRIIVGEGAVSYLNSIIKTDTQLPGQANEDFKIWKNTATRCKQMLTQDLDGCTILDYIGETFIDILKRNPETNYKKVFRDAFDFIRKEYMRFKKDENRLLTLRYYLLYDYFKSREKYYL